MKKTYIAPVVSILICEDADILTYSISTSGFGDQVIFTKKTKS